MLRRSVSTLTLILLAVGLALTATHSYAQDVTAPRLDAAVERIVTTLDLSPETAEQLRQAVAENEQQAGTPGFLWHVTADLQAALTPAQKEELLTAADAVPMDGPMARTPRGRRGQAGARLLGRGVPDLTDEQREEIARIHASYADSTRALRQQRRAAIAEVLTDEQEAALKAHVQQRRDLRQDRRWARQTAARQEAAEVLDLTEEQQAALDALRQEQQEQAEALREQVRSGALTVDEAAAERADLRTEGQAARADILTPEQLETVDLHRVLARHTAQAMRPMHRGLHRGHRSGPRR
ncbi:MAG: hypothetical protein GVY18_14560 [Bacteroidetes bacterium]|jgi:Spy/CpxP family protein refolding chaperone|nr:hypothetical protein [Bacteroidota bacterium]